MNADAVPPPTESSATLYASWFGPLVATLILQITAAFLTRVIPTIAPTLMLEFAWPETVVGYLAAVNTVGSIAFLILGSPLIRRTGSIRALQIGLGVGIVGLVLLTAPILVAPVVASFIFGFGYGPSAPAGSDILQRYAPPRRRNLIFSIKQSGVPVGGVLAGVALPPIAEIGGWRMSLAFAAGVVILTILVVQPLRDRIDADRSRIPLTTRAFFGTESLTRPIASLASAPGLTRLALAGACLAVGQGAWFAFLITYLVFGLQLSLTTAGLIFSAMQATGILGRVLLGWISDRTGPGAPTLTLVAVASATTSLALALTNPSWPLWSLALLAAIGGVTVSSWNGVQIAEIARNAPGELVSETIAGSTILIFLGYVVGPAAFAAVVATTGRFDAAFVCIAAATLGAVFSLPRIERRSAVGTGELP